MAKWSTKNLFKDESGDRQYFAMIPTMLWPDIKKLKIPLAEIAEAHIKELGIELSVHDRWLYATIKRICGEEGGECFLSTPSLARLAGMSVGKVSDAKTNLEKAGLIVIISKKRSSKGRPIDHITVVDIWERNIVTIKARQKKHELENDFSRENGLSSRMDGLNSLNETEEEPMKKNQLEEESISPIGDEIPDSDLPPEQEESPKKVWYPPCEYEHEDGTTEIIEDESWRQDKKQIDRQILLSAGLDEYPSKKHWNKARRVEKKLERGEICKRYLENRCYNAENLPWGLDKLLNSLLNPNHYRKWQEREAERERKKARHER